MTIAPKESKVFALGSLDSVKKLRKVGRRADARLFICDLRRQSTGNRK
jgi:hypothetical protein